VEDGRSAFLSHLQQLRDHAGVRQCFGAVIYRDGWDTDSLAQLNNAGVRVLRYHAALTHKEPQDIAATVKLLLSGRLGEILRAQKWALSMQLPLAVWALLEDVEWSMMLPGVTVIAEHLASINVPLSAEAEIHFESILRQMRGGLVVKICAMHRRMTPGHEVLMENLVRRLADAGGEQLLWGSDWPHVNSRAVGLAPAPFLEADAHAELAWLRSNLPPTTFSSMLYSTPERILCRAMAEK
jgi:predicted TIM-barrel fold metal-dependent hydrolase